MIATLSGKVAHIGPDRMIIEVGGVGFEVLAPLGVLEEASRAETIRLFTHLHVREDALTLFGFTRMNERVAFERLIAISGIGPKTALAILSTYPPDRLAQIIRSGDPSGLKGVPGVGPKTAGRLILELQGKLSAATLDTAGFIDGNPGDDSVAALVALGYPANSAIAAVERARKESGSNDTAILVRLALKILAGP